MTSASSEFPEPVGEASSIPSDSKSILSSIRTPDDLGHLSDMQLETLASEIRAKLISCLSKTGGHLGPNLGVVELTIAMHRVFSTPKDKFVFDVSHQGYVHKMLTGRAEQIETIRTYKGLNGFLLRTESEHDAYGAGHAGTALSAALGMAAARDLEGGDNHVVAVAGDAAFTCGPTLEALNNIAETTKKFIVVLNDNEWSIDRNVGAIARYFNALQTHSTYSAVRTSAADFVEKVLGKAVRKIAHRVEEGAKNLIFPNVLFEKFGLRYFGPIDGHNLPLLVKTFEHLKTLNEPVVLHIITEKGRGYQPALDNPGKFHGLGAYSIEDGSTDTVSTPTCSEIFGRTVTDLAIDDSKIVAITAAMPGGTKLETFKKELPDRYFDVGIAEEHAALFACGLAAEGHRPFLAIYSTFMQRAYDMIIHDMALQNLPVRLCMDRGGLSGDDGPTHHGLFDIGYLRHIPNIIHMQPKDEAEFVAMLKWMAKYDDGPTAIRYPRGVIAGSPVSEKTAAIELGKGELIQEGTDVALIGLGTCFEMAVKTKELLEAKGLSVSLVNPRFIKPMDTALLEKVASNCKVVCTFEDHVLSNGFGAACIEHLHDADISTHVERIGWPDEFIEHGKPDTLMALHGLTAEAALDKILRHFKI
ncbi:MAG: 1-deoxy-D-xylulose-5-phosphate synthase [Akkermansiaceae bacterium]|jgi:1-deoxy-D-xylulose-5-phosphate synthase|nr:1-deoxy-D-xylulose-5-phosphate synthase [Akkermansiaceae bacterium]MDP4646805.1 1-deoxy-D-xylulose-5-phosphate synthase [Akkermansiaceae bacterium]MDP4719995.1 1-deoxy-D-xylulose-5-phosphate synthase [Akkermansiaceae bacterium]MDP4779721.1 1-deoxy-D-xylulose-5-phosphate synthase [Akkermansiaceae bacterium]MDP4846618.1 1-deoxy-D-xylulose-5-phosphate synthase [Akkermansiaceae bacterium]